MRKITAVFKIGEEIKKVDYTDNILSLLMTDENILYIIDRENGEVIFSK